MKHLFIIFLLLFISQCQLFAQLDSFSLKTYIPPDFQRQFLALNPDITQSHTNSATLIRNLFTFNFDISYNVQLVKNKHSLESSLNSRIGYEFDKLNGTQITKKSLFRTNQSLSINYDYYFKGLWHIATAIESSRYNNTYNSITDDLQVYFPFQIGIGFGRPQIITDAWHAKTIISDLQRTGVDTNIDDITSFADFIYQLKRKRVFDTRLFEIDQLESLYSHLKENNIADFTPRMAALVNDSWQYEAFTTRKNGYKIWMAISSAFNNPQIYPYSANSIGILIQANHFYPLNDDWQFDNIISYHRFTNLEAQVVSQTKSLDINRWVLSYQSRLGWYPSRRINFSTALISSISHISSYQDLDHKTYNFRSISALNYYINPQIIFSIDLFLDLNKNEAQNEQVNINQSIRYKLIYYIK